MRMSKTILPLLSAVLLGISANAQSANVVLVNLDPPGVGLNDNTPASPIDGNPGTTIGEQRVNVYLLATDIWGQSLQSDVPIFVGATFQPLPCSSAGGVLGAAGPTFVNANYPNAGRADTWHVTALADAQSGEDQVPGEIDIISFFNSDIDDDDPNCLTGTTWYYGFNHDEAANEIDFLTVVLHEINHGLGHLDLVDEDDGTLFQGLRDTYTLNMLDLTLGDTWDNLTNAERLFSQVNTDNLVWNGNEVSSQAARFLGPRGGLFINFPHEIEEAFEAQPASFGKPLRKRGREGILVVADDGVGATTDGCEPLVGSRKKYRRRVVLLDRGGCAFTTKVANAQAVGARSAIVANNVPNGRPPMGGSDPDIRIQSVGVTMALGDLLKDQIEEHFHVFVEMKLDRSVLAGTSEGLVRLNAPSPVQPGSSKSHWDPSATPNLLMEPSINGDLEPSVNLDLSPALLEDIGWTLLDPPLRPIRNKRR